MSDHFDVAILGTQTAGLIAATLLAKQERRVVVFDHGENAKFYRHHGVHMPLAPTLIPSFEESPVIKQVHHALGVEPEIRNSITVQSPCFQAVTDKHRVDVFADRAAFLTELGHEFPEVVKPVERFFERLYAADEEISDVIATLNPVDPPSWRTKLSLGRKKSALEHLDAPFEESDLLAGVPEDHPIRDLLLGPLMFFGYLDPMEPSALHATRLIARYFRGTLTFNDRLSGLHKVLVHAALDAGVVFRKNAIIQQLTLEGRNVTRVSTGGDRHASADFFIHNSLSALEEILPPSKANAKVSEEARSVVPSKSLLVWNLLVNRNVIPCGMSEALFLLNGRRVRREEETRDPPIFLRLYPAQRGEASRARGQGPEIDPTFKVISLAIPVRTNDVAKSPERLAQLKKQLRARIGRLIPFLDDYLVETSLPSDTQAWDLESDVVRAIDPWSIHPLYESQTRPWLGVAVRPNRGYLKNVIYAGRDIFPGLGLEGEYMAGLRAVESILHSSKKRV